MMLASLQVASMMTIGNQKLLPASINTSLVMRPTPGHGVHVKHLDDRQCSCFAEVLGSLKCDCAEQLQLAMEHIQEHGTGIIIYLQQEGRGIGLSNKIAAYSLQVQMYAMNLCCQAYICRLCLDWSGVLDFDSWLAQGSIAESVHASAAGKGLRYS